MAITDPSDEIVAQLTDIGRDYLARAINGELVYQAVGFSCGRGGYNPLDPVKVIPITGAELALTDQVFPAVTGTEPFEFIEQPLPTTVVFNCRLPASLIATNADYGLGEIGIWAEVIYTHPSASSPPTQGDVFLLALANMPIRAKTRRDVMLFRVVVQL